MKVFSTAFAVLSAASLAAGHMEMTDPAPLRSKFNKYTTDTDYEMKSPMDSKGTNFPCRGGLKVLGTSQAQPVADWTAGQSLSLTIAGQAFHGGGSCQASLSYDKGKSWKVIYSWIGSCPTGPGETKYNFGLPSNVQAGEAIFAWSWFNKIGNREMYMNCAVVNIKGRQGRKKRGTDESMSQRPDMFVANVGNGCTTVEGTDLDFPNPGPDVDMSKASNVKLGNAVGNCQKPAPGGDKPTVPAPDNSSKPSPTPSKTTPPQSTSTGGQFPDEQNKPAQPPSSTGSPTKPTKPTKPTFPALPPTPPSNGNNTTSSAAPSPSKPAPSTVLPQPTSIPTQVVPTPGDDNDVCTPGVFGCTPDNAAWRVCAVTQNWVRAGECPQGTVCQFNELNKTPYCVQSA